MTFHKIMHPDGPPAISPTLLVLEIGDRPALVFPITESTWAKSRLRCLRVAETGGGTQPDSRFLAEINSSQSEFINFRITSECQDIARSSQVLFHPVLFSPDLVTISHYLMINVHT